MRYFLILILLGSAAFVQAKDLAPKECPVVGNTESRIYHIQGDRFYAPLLKQNKQDDNRKCFQTQKEAREAGYRRSEK